MFKIFASSNPKRIASSIKFFSLDLELIEDSVSLDLPLKDVPVYELLLSDISV